MRKKLASLPWFATMLFIAATASLFARFRSSAYLNFYDDDAFYYFQIARNIATHHGSTFDGIHLTNGYHPLWMLTLVVLSLVSSGKTFFVLLQCITLVCFIATFLAARGAFRCLSNDPLATEIAASAVALQSLLLFRSGMEVTLAIPLALMLCWYRLRPSFRWTPPVAAGYGLLGALVVLSRLDAAFFIAALFLLELVLERRQSLRAWSSGVVAMVFGAVPLLLYFLSNRLWFHVWMPVSGEAKQLRLHHSFNLATIAASLRTIDFTHRLVIIYPTFFTLILCAAFLIPKGQRLRRSVLAVSVGLVLLPFLQSLTFWTLSDWPIWPWYLYSLPLAMTGAFLLLFHRYPDPQTSIRREALVILRSCAMVFALFYAATCTPGPSQSRGYVFGKDLESFARTHNGTYAMGDCAGTPGYLIRQPVVQLEGLVMDAPFLDNIREQRDLKDVLKNYGVRYYVTPDATLVDGCYRTKEPVQAGPDSPSMHGTFCREPVASFPHGANNDSTVRIFDLQPDSVDIPVMTSSSFVIP
jgi:hypothetical protein